MTISSLEAAKQMCELSNWTLTHLKLQKLLYLAHMVHLGRAGKPLISENFEAWTYGPIIPSLYKKLGFFGNSEIKNIFHMVNSPSSHDEIIKSIYDFFGKKESWELSRLTRSLKGAWVKNYNLDCQRIIPNSDILEEYKKRQIKKDEQNVHASTCH